MQVGAGAARGGASKGGEYQALIGGLIKLQRRHKIMQGLGPSGAHLAATAPSTVPQHAGIALGALLQAVSLKGGVRPCPRAAVERHRHCSPLARDCSALNCHDR